MSATRKPRKAYRPKHVNPGAWAIAMQGAMLLSKTDQVTRAMRVHDSVERISRGEHDMVDWRRLFDAVNMLDALSSMPSVMRGGREFVERLMGVVADAVERQRDTGTRALRAGELQALRELSALWAEVLGVVTHREFFEASERVERTVARVLRGDVRAGERVVEAA